MKKEILVNVSPLETRVAALEDGRLVEIMTEPAGTTRIVGNIYKGRVSEILPGLQAAFIDIGLDRNAFLHAEDLVTDVHDIGNFLDEDYQHDRRRGKHPPIEEVLNRDQDILVQVTKEPIGKKGPRATTNITLAGRFLVLMPYADHVGVSRKISSSSERNRLRGLVKDLRSGKTGFIIRTIGEGASKRQLRQEMRYLNRQAREIVRRANKVEAPALVHDDLGLVLSLVRDVVSDEVDAVVIDDRGVYNRIKEFSHRVAPDLGARIEHYSGRYPIFEAYGVEKDIERITHRKVWLKCGGYLVIEQTEALISVDVNTGKNVGKHNLEKTVYETNLEAADEIARQLRLRDLGGIIILDFIDMEVAKHRDNVVRRLNKALSRDRTKHRVRKMSDLGLVEMTRKRVRKSVTSQMTDKCPCCGGSGLVLAERNIILKTESTLKRGLSKSDSNRVQLLCNPHVAQLLKTRYQDMLNRLSEEFQRRIIIQTNPTMPFDELQVKDLKDTRRRPTGRRGRRQKSKQDQQ